jgi:hypothetical protein
VFILNVRALLRTASHGSDTDHAEAALGQGAAGGFLPPAALHIRVHPGDASGEGQDISHDAVGDSFGEGAGRVED